MRALAWLLCVVCLMPAWAGAAAPQREAWSGSIVYELKYGSAGLPLGRTEHRWQIDEQQYSLHTEVSTTGLVAMLKSFSYRQFSRGEVSRLGLRPVRLDVSQSGKRDESAEFDWKGGEVVIRRGEGKIRRAPIQPGDQDVLSLWHQVRWLPVDSPAAMLVATNKAAVQVRIEWQGVERLSLPAGEFVARKLQVLADDRALDLEIWLSDDARRLPLRVRMTERKGDVIDQLAREIRLGSAN